LQTGCHVTQSFLTKSAITQAFDIVFGSLSGLIVVVIVAAMFTNPVRHFDQAPQMFAATVTAPY
jgi:hypothetical protein